MQTESESEEQGEVLTALELVDADQDDGEGPGLIPRYRVYREAEQGNGIGPAVAAINRAYSNVEQQGQSLAALTAIGPAHNGIKLGDLLASPALDSVREAMRANMVGVTEQMAATVRASISSFAVGAAEHVTRQMTASLSELPRLMLGNDAFENLRRASMGESAIEIMRGAGISDSIRGMDTWKDATESLRLASGVSLSGAARQMLGEDMLTHMRASLGASQGISSRWEEATESLSLVLGAADGIGGHISAMSALNDAYDGVGAALGITGGISSAMSLWEDSLASVMDRQREQALQSINDFARNYATEQAAISRRMNESLSQYASVLRAEQQQREKAMYAAFADMGRWQGPSILWRDAVPHHWQVYEPEPEPSAEPFDMEYLPEGDWRKLIDFVVEAGKATEKQILDYLQQRSGRLSRMPSPTELEETCNAYQILKSKGLTVDAIARRLGMSRAKLYRWLKMAGTFLQQ